MKSKHTAQSAPARRSRLLRRSICEGWVGEAGFFNLRLLIGVFIVVAGVFVALAGLGAFSALTASMARAQQSNNIIATPKTPWSRTNLIVPKFMSSA